MEDERICAEEKPRRLRESQDGETLLTKGPFQAPKGHMEHRLRVGALQRAASPNTPLASGESSVFSGTNRGADIPASSDSLCI